jgi:hypothetical protein
MTNFYNWLQGGREFPGLSELVSNGGKDYMMDLEEFHHSRREEFEHSEGQVLRARILNHYQGRLELLTTILQALNNPATEPLLIILMHYKTISIVPNRNGLLALISRHLTRVKLDNLLDNLQRD